MQDYVKFRFKRAGVGATDSLVLSVDEFRQHRIEELERLFPVEQQQFVSTLEISDPMIYEEARRYRFYDDPLSLAERREIEKEYRLLAQARSGGAKAHPHGRVEPGEEDEDGAWVEVKVWVPRAHLNPTIRERARELRWLKW